MHHFTGRERGVLCVGVPLWQYNTDLVLLEALNSVARTLEYLAKRGIVHRDLSCHNVLVGLGGEKGLVLDLDFASRFPAHEMRTGDNSEPTYSAVGNASCDLAPDHLMPCDANGHVLGLESQLDRERRQNTHAASDLNLENIPRKLMLPVLTTLQFAAHDVLKAAQDNEHLIPTASHDLESLYWVIGHTVLARLLSRVLAAQEDLSPTIKEEETTTVFTTLMGVASAQFWPTDSTGRLDLQQLRASRRTGGPLQWLFHDPALLTFFADNGNAGAPLLRLIISMSKEFDGPSQIAAAKDRAFQALCARQHGDYTSSTLRTLEVPPPRLSLETLKGYIEIAVESEKARPPELSDVKS
ncbi:hypothetical protein EXIGLDRAFT_844102 [Exidia glandulosa HHB12029]|uniref:Fungal-type protein kinase domain-containing protein n=1 Tax=Exidia glandulosa HHB12029 TaxID=1314781 RepID=A0A165C8W4_EXIGL|nr:hypothetical protein EXIGLDRAFT_844102 [Exidia glandulosa HHB12029]